MMWCTPSLQQGCRRPRKRAIQYAAASRFIAGVSGILDHPLSRAMTAGHNFAISPHVFARGFVIFVPLSRKEGAGNAGRSMHPQPGEQKG
jgi:hypothetical protein